MAALVVVVVTFAVEDRALAQTAETVSIGTVGLLPGGAGKEVPVTVSNLSVGAGDQGLGVLSFEFAWDKSVIDVVGFTPVLDTQEYNVSANLIASTSTGQFLPAPFGANTGRGIVSIDWASLPPPDAVAGTFTIGNIMVDAAPGVTVGMSTPIRLAVTEFATNSNVDPVQGFAVVDGQVNIVDEISVDIELQVGFNLIGLPVTMQITSREIAEAVLPPGTAIEDGPVVLVLGWDASRQVFDFWSSTPGTSPGAMVDIEQGVFVRVREPVTWTVTGPPIDTPTNLDLAAGFNLVSFPKMGSAHTALTFAQALLPDGTDINQGPVVLVLGWDASRQVFDFWSPEGGKSILIDSTPDDGLSAYFVRMREPLQTGPLTATIGAQAGVTSEPSSTCRGNRGIVDYLLFNGPLQFLLPVPCVSEALGLDIP